MQHWTRRAGIPDGYALHGLRRFSSKKSRFWRARRRHDFRQKINTLAAGSPTHIPRMFSYGLANPKPKRRNDPSSLEGSAARARERQTAPHSEWGWALPPANKTVTNYGAV